MLATLSRLTNQVLALDPEATERLSLLGITVIACGGRGATQHSGVNLRFAQGAVAFESFDPHVANARLYAGPVSALQYFFRGAHARSNVDARVQGPRVKTPDVQVPSKQTPDTQIIGVRASRVRIEGDVGAVQEIAAILRRLEIDWEEPASRLLGDTGTYFVGRALRGVTGWVRETHELVRERIGEYVAYEADVAVTQGELTAFSVDVEHLAGRTARLSDRIARLREQRNV